MHRLPTLALLALALSAPVGAQTSTEASDSTATAFARATARARAALAADGGRLWGAPLDTVPWMGVDGRTVLLTDDPHRDGYAPRTGGIWRGALPDGISPANTSIDWANRRWAMFVLPLPADTLDAARLLLHEASHVLQPALLPSARYDETAAGSDLLDAPEGRTWLRLEWRALETALESRGAARRRATLDALTFRARRLAVATSAEGTRERGLEIVEGLSEYTAWMLTGGADTSFARHLRASAERSASYVRAFAYLSGPAYAFLLDDATRGAWRARVRDAHDLGALLARAIDAPNALVAALGGDSSTVVAARVADLRRDADRAGARHALAAVRAEEMARWRERARVIADLRARYIDGPTLRLRPGPLRLAFDPRRQTSLGAAGTVMGGLTWRGSDGAELVADDGALVSGDWSELRVPLDGATIEPGVVAARLQLTGRGWRLTVPAGWMVRAEESSRALTPPAR